MAEARLAGLLEAALYYDSGDADAITELYERILGLPVVAEWPDGRALRLGSTLLLLFDRDLLAGREGPISDHGATGPGHVCFTAAEGDYAEWKRRIAERTEVVHEHEWPRGGRSFYFRDPAGNLLEIADRDIWPT